MDRKVIAVLFAATLVMSVVAIGMAAAEITTQKTEFNLDGYYETFDPATGIETIVPARAILTGNIRDADGTWYLSPQRGTITIDGIENQIQVRPLKQSEPVIYGEEVDGSPDTGNYYIDQYWFTMVEVNIGGKKYTGRLGWDKIYEEWDGGSEEYGYSYLEFYGIVDGKDHQSWLDGDFPING